MANEGQRQYDRYWEHVRQAARLHPANRFRYHLVMRLLSRVKRPPGRVFDLGCGDASLLTSLKALYPMAALVGSDVSPKQAQLNKSAFQEMTFICADAANSSFADVIGVDAIGSFDLVVATEVIEHVSNDEIFMDNLRLLVKPGGYAVLTTQSGPRYRMDREILGHLRHYQRSKLEAMFTTRGFRIVRSFNAGFPILTLQKILVDRFFDRAVEAAASGTEPTRVMKAVMTAMYWGMIASPILKGPQIVILAQDSARRS